MKNARAFLVILLICASLPVFIISCSSRNGDNLNENTDGPVSSSADGITTVDTTVVDTTADTTVDTVANTEVATQESADMSPQLSDYSIDITPKPTEEGSAAKTPTDSYILAAADFCTELFKHSAVQKGNTLLSPLSILSAIQVTANGADGNTLKEFEDMLGGMPLSELNEYIAGYVGGLGDGVVSANSIWIKNTDNSLQMNPHYLPNTLKYLNLTAYSAPFDETTSNDIGIWIEKNTKGRITDYKPSLEGSVLAIANAVTFDAKWFMQYAPGNISDGSFTDVNGNESIVSMMRSVESRYIETEDATGFIKPYEGKYDFVALLPKGDIKEYISSITGEKLLGAIESATSKKKVIAKLPAFEYNCKYNDLKETLVSMGWRSAFDYTNADFSKMATYAGGNLFVGGIGHATYIKLDNIGTEAGAATVVTMAPGASEPPEYVYVTLDRPFVYCIIDTNTSLPIFIGSVETFAQN